MFPQCITVCIADSSWGPSVWLLGLKGGELPDSGYDEFGMIEIKLKGLFTETLRNNPDVVWLYNKELKGYEERIHAKYDIFLSDVIRRQRELYHDELGAPFSGDVDEDVDYRLRAIVYQDGAKSNIDAKEKAAMEPGYAAMSKKEKVSSVV